MPPRLSTGTLFEVPRSGKKKYVAVVPRAGRRPLRVGFGHRDYQHYKDQVPRALGGGRWARLDHRDPARRARYRARHAGMVCKDARGTPVRCIDRRHSPAWFSYHFLW